MSDFKIKTLTIISGAGVKRYEIGKKYNGFTLYKIEDVSLEFENSYHNIYCGFTKENDPVFNVENAPVDVEYTKI